MFIDNILTPIVHTNEFQKAKRWHRGFTFHINNSIIRRSKKVNDFIQLNGLQNAPYTASSPDLSSSDFILLGCIKKKYKEIEFSSLNEFKQSIIDKFSRSRYAFFIKLFYA